jgi:5-methylcytosine-specific restriction endonuclease McrA
MNSSLRSKKPIRKVRKGARPGRLKGKAMASLRLLAFLRDDGVCVDCGKILDWATFHLAHVKAKRRNGDSLENVRCKCFECHHREHNPKVVPRKEAA